MQKLLAVLTVVVVLGWGNLFVAHAQVDAALCEATVREAFETTGANCGAVGADQVCYGNGEIEAVPRYITTDFTFDTPGTLLDINQLETVRTQPLDAEAETFGVVRLQLGEAADGLAMLMFGEALLTNNVIPGLELAMTVNTFVSVQAEPAVDSEAVGALVPGDAVQGRGRFNPDPNDFDITEDTWVRVSSPVGVGWIPANTVTEDYLVSSLTVVSAEVSTADDVQAFSFVGNLEDRACVGAVDSGLLMQTSLNTGATVRINGAVLTTNPGTTVYVQDRADNAMIFYVLEGGLDVNIAEVLWTVQAGQLISVAVGPDGQPNGPATPPSDYSQSQFETLSLLQPALPRELVITPSSTQQLQSDVVFSSTSESTPTPAVSEQADTAEGEAVVAEPVVTEAAAPPPAAVSTSAFAATIQARGVVRVGVNGTLPGFSLEQDGNYSGFEIELARALVARLFGDDVSVEFVNISARQRPTALVDGRVDLMVRNTGFEPGREAWGEWTNTFYFVDGQRFIVRADSGYAGLDDFQGRTIAVQAGTPAQATLDEAAESVGFTVTPVQGIITDAFQVFTNGQADAFSGDWTVLAALADTTGAPADYAIVGDLLTEVPWNVVVPPGETEFLNEVEAALLEIISDGTWARVYTSTLRSDLPDSIALLFTPVEGGVAVAVAEEATPAQESPPEPTEAPPVEVEEEAAETSAEAAPPASASSDFPVTGEIPVRIFTAETQQRTIRITPEGDEFFLELIRNGEVVYEANYRFYESSGRYENVRSSFEYVEFSDTAGDTSLGCDRAPDIRGFFNGAEFEGRVGC